MPCNALLVARMHPDQLLGSVIWRKPHSPDVTYTFIGLVRKVNEGIEMRFPKCDEICIYSFEFLDLIHCATVSEMYLEPCQTSTVKLFAKIVDS